MTSMTVLSVGPGNSTRVAEASCSPTDRDLYPELPLFNPPALFDSALL